MIVNMWKLAHKKWSDEIRMDTRILGSMNYSLYILVCGRWIVYLERNDWNIEIWLQ